MRLAQGVIIDPDGTLLDSNGARAQAWVEALKEAGHPVAYADLQRLMGLAPKDILVRAIGFGVETEEGRAIHARARKIFSTRLLPRLVPFYRARELLRQIAGWGLRVATINQDPPEVAAALLRPLGAESLAAQSPAVPPDVSARDLVKAALDRVGASPPHVLMIADSPYDIETAAHLNVPVIALESGGWDAKSLSKARAVYQNAEHLLAELHESPIAALVTHGQP